MITTKTLFTLIACITNVKSQAAPSACPTLTPLGEEMFRSMTFSQQATLTSDIDLTPYLEPDCIGELTITPEQNNEGCFTVPGGPDGGWLFENPEFGAKLTPDSI